MWNIWPMQTDHSSPVVESRFSNPADALVDDSLPGESLVGPFLHVLEATTFSLTPVSVDATELKENQLIFYSRFISSHYCLSFLLLMIDFDGTSTSLSLMTIVWPMQHNISSNMAVNLHAIVECGIAVMFLKWARASILTFW